MRIKKVFLYLNIFCKYNEDSFQDFLFRKELWQFDVYESSCDPTGALELGIQRSAASDMDRLDIYFHISAFVGEMIPLFRISGNICPDLQTLHALSPMSDEILRFTSSAIPANTLEERLESC